MEDVVVGIVLALVASTVVPFVTAQASVWIEQRRERDKRLRELYEAVIVSQITEGVASRKSDIERWAEAMHAHNDEKNVALVTLKSYFGPRDRHVRTVCGWWGTHGAPDSANEVMSLWATGHQSEARRLARRLVKSGVTGIKTPPAQSTAAQSQQPEQSKPPQEA